MIVEGMAGIDHLLDAAVRHPAGHFGAILKGANTRGYRKRIEHTLRLWQADNHPAPLRQQRYDKRMGLAGARHDKNCSLRVHGCDFKPVGDGRNRLAAPQSWR